MRFTIEQIFLSDVRGQPEETGTRYHVVEAEDVDSALADFLSSEGATLVGTIQRYPGFQALATARTSDTAFTLHLIPGSDAFPRQS